MNFYIGFLAGLLLKDQIIGILGRVVNKCITIYHKFHKPKSIQKHKKAFLVCKITDNELFNEYFPVLNTKSRVQPHWEYSPNKEVIKIGLEDLDFEELPCVIIDLLDNSGLDIDFFESFCELGVYVHYFHENAEYINIYGIYQTIKPEDFHLNESVLSKKYKNIVCATFKMHGKTIYLTKYFKKFLNNTNEITINQLLIYNDEINTLNGDLQIVDNQIVKIYSINEKI
jgi:hypothetical protein